MGRGVLRAAVTQLPSAAAYPSPCVGDLVGRACAHSFWGSVLLPLQGSTGRGGVRAGAAARRSSMGPGTLHPAITLAPGLHGAAGSWHVGSAGTLGLPPRLLQLAQACALRVFWGMPRVHRHPGFSEVGPSAPEWPCLSLVERPGGRRGECRCPGTPPAPLPPSWCRTGAQTAGPGVSWTLPGSLCTASVTARVPRTQMPSRCPAD